MGGIKTMSTGSPIFFSPIACGQLVWLAYFFFTLLHMGACWWASIECVLRLLLRLKNTARTKWYKLHAFFKDLYILVTCNWLQDTPFVPTQAFTGLECSHRFCSRCWKEYITTKVMDEHVGEVGCKCNVFFSDYLRQKKTIELRNQMFLT